MIYFNGFKKRKCSLINNTIVVDGVSYPVKYVEEMEDSELLINFLIILLLFCGVIMAYYFVPVVIGIARHIYFGGIRSSLLFVMLIIVFTVTVYSHALIYLIRIRGFSGCWKTKIHGNKLLLLEETDDPDIRNDLERLKKENIVR